MGVKVYHNGNWVEFSTGSNASASFLVQDEGTDLVGFATALNFKGSGVTASNTTGNPSTKIIDISATSTFIGLTDTPQNYTNAANKFVRVNSTADALEFLTQTPTTGAAGNDKQVQFNDGTNLAGADSLEFVKTSYPAYGLYLKPISTDTSNYGGGRISAETKYNTSTNAPWNRASITADGALELFRTRVVSPVGGPHIDFKSQMGDGDPTQSTQEEDMDARIQMDYALTGSGPYTIDPNSDDYSAITFQTGGKGYHSSGNTNGNVIERLRIGKNGEIGILAGPTLANSVPNTRSDADRYGQSGYVLTSNGKGNSVSWTSKGTPSGSGFTTPLTVRLPATQPGTNLNDTVNIAEFNSNTGVNQSKLLIYNKRTIAGGGWENTAMFIQRQIDDPNTVGDNFGWIQFGDGSGTGGKNGSTLHFGTGYGAGAGERLRIDGDGDVGIGTTNPNAVVNSTNTAKLAVGIVTCHELYVNGTKTTGSSSGAIANPQYSYITSSNPVTGYATWTDVLTLSYTPSSSTTKILIQVAGDANSSSSNSSEARIARKNGAGAFIQLGMKISVPNSSTKRMDQFIIDDLTVNTPESGGTQNYRIQIQSSTSTNQASSTIGNASILISEILA